MLETAEAPSLDVLMGEWHPRSLRTPRPPLLPTRMRSALMAAVIVLHVIVLGWLLPLLDPPLAGDEQALQVEFIAPAPALPMPVETIVIPMPTRTSPTTTALPARPSPQAAPRPKPSVVPGNSAAQKKPQKLELYGSDGRLKLPADLLDQIDRKYGDKRVFSYQVPRMDDGAKLWNRPPPVVYEDTRFAQYWKPDQDLLTALLTEMVEKTTREVRIKMPGKSNSTVVCRVSLLAFGGGCGVQVNILVKVWSR